MKDILLAGVMALAVAATSSAYAETVGSPSNHARPSYPASALDPLNSLFLDWDRIGFNPPSKPGQYRVYARDGHHVTNGPGYNAMVTLLRSAARDAQAGRDADALTKIAKIRDLLSASDLRKEWNNG